MKKIAVLFVMKNSVYYQFPECVCYDEARDARSFKGGMAIIAHPPCRLWGKLRHFSSANPEEKELALWSIDMIRKNGGILEHPFSSRLFQKLPKIGQRDEYGGFVLAYPQYFWGHKAEKATKFYICGIDVKELPEVPFRMGKPDYVVSSTKIGKDKRKEISKKERSATPIELAKWMIKVAMMVK